MANYQQLKAAIAEAINNNGQGAITGQVLQDTLKEIVDVVGEGYTFVGLATLTTVPSVGDSKVFYLASQVGTYSNFDGIVVGEGLTVLKYDTAWSAVQVLSFDFIDTKLETYIAQTQAEIDNIVGDLESASTEDVESLKDILVANNYGYSVIQDIGHSTSTNKMTIVSPNSAFKATYTANQGSRIYGAVVTMGGTDITSTSIVASSSTDIVRVVSIAHVTGNVEITIIATKPITFVDPAVKAICVQYWGGQYIESEITEYEASRVASIGQDKNGNDIADGAGPFYNNTTITSFNEFRYFTGISGSGMYWTNTGTSVDGERGRFAGCTALEEITLPKSPYYKLSGIFYYCQNLKKADLSALVTNVAGVTARKYCAVMFTNCNALEEVYFPDDIDFVASNTRKMFGTSNLPKLKTIDFKGLDFSDSPNQSGTPSNMLHYVTKLENLPSGMHNLAHSQSFVRNTKLSHESAVRLLLSLSKVTSQTITLYSSVYSTLTEDEISIATDKGWTVTSAS